jgi:hypothetical protein
MFTQEEKLQLFNRLPALELSYEPKLHKKVYSALYYIIPKGPKALVWYTYWREEHVCLLILLNERGNYSDIKLYPSCFSDALALGTVIYGTHFISKGISYFTCEQLYYYKGVDVRRDKRRSYLDRLQMLVEMFQKEVEQVAYTTSSLVVGLPVMTETYEEALDIMEKGDLPYKLYGIGGAPLQPPFGSLPTIPVAASAPPIGSLPTTPLAASATPRQNTFGKTATPRQNTFGKTATPRQNTFGNKEPNIFISKGNTVTPSGGRGGVTPLLVKADLAADTYTLYNPGDNSFVGTAMVPTYKCSVFLNGLFRNIKENKNLDLLEESDDEEEFENIQLDKFVDLEKSFLMECVFLKRFQKWQPVKLIKM